MRVRCGPSAGRGLGLGFGFGFGFGFGGHSRREAQLGDEIKRPHRRVLGVGGSPLGVRAGRCRECSRPGP